MVIKMALLWEMKLFFTVDLATSRFKTRPPLNITSKARNTSKQLSKLVEKVLLKSK